MVKAVSSPMIGQCLAIKQIEANIARVGRNTDVAILINGETGTGKEVVARLIHAQSHEKGAPLIAINCAGIPDQLLETELFGHEKGAFTGATQNKRGLLELANGGTLLLDEIGDMGMGSQAKLLKAVEEQQFRRVGGEKVIRVAVRIIACTNVDLEQAIAEGAFRQDLYFRLNELEITLPPLRQRDKDVLLLAEYFIAEFSQLYQIPLPKLSQESKLEFCSYPWPGNIRELRNVIKRAMIMDKGPVLTPLLEGIGLAVSTGEKGREFSLAEDSLVIDIPDEGIPFDKIEKLVIDYMLKVNSWNKSQTSRKMKISYPRLLRKIANYGLFPPANRDRRK